MDRTKLEEAQAKFLKDIDTQLTKAMKSPDETIIPTGEFEAVTKALNEQEKQKNEAARIEMERAKAEMEAELERQRLELEREKLEQEAKIAQERNDAEYDRTILEATANDQKSKRELIGRILDLIGKVLVAILGLTISLVQVFTIVRQEENDEFVNSRSIQFWHKGSTKG